MNRKGPHLWLWCCAAVLMPLSSLSVLAISASNGAFSRTKSPIKNESLTQPALT